MPWNAPTEQPASSQTDSGQASPNDPAGGRDTERLNRDREKWRQRGIGPMFLELDSSGAVRYRLEAVQQYLSDCASMK